MMPKGKGYAGNSPMKLKKGYEKAGKGMKLRNKDKSPDFDHGGHKPSNQGLGKRKKFVKKRSLNHLD
jgi:hypothetical protein